MSAACCIIVCRQYRRLSFARVGRQRRKIESCCWVAASWIRLRVDVMFLNFPLSSRFFSLISCEFNDKRGREWGDGGWMSDGRQNDLFNDVRRRIKILNFQFIRLFFFFPSPISESRSWANSRREVSLRSYTTFIASSTYCHSTLILKIKNSHREFSIFSQWGLISFFYYFKCFALLSALTGDLQTEFHLINFFFFSIAVTEFHRIFFWISWSHSERHHQHLYSLPPSYFHSIACEGVQEGEGIQFVFIEEEVMRRNFYRFHFHAMKIIVRERSAQTRDRKEVFALSQSWWWLHGRELGGLRQLSWDYHHHCRLRCYKSWFSASDYVEI